jgi:hypothetical protein
VAGGAVTAANSNRFARETKDTAVSRLGDELSLLAARRHPSLLCCCQLLTKRLARHSCRKEAHAHQQTCC